MSEQRLDRLRQMTTEEQAEAFKRMNEAIERIVADPSAVPLESMIEELLKDGACACELSVRYDAALDAYSVRLLDEDGETIVGRFRSSVHAGIQDVSGAWRERRNADEA